MIKIKNWFIKASLKKKIILLIVVIGIGWFVYSKLIGAKASQPQYQTAQAEKGTLIVSIAGSGTVSTLNNSPVTTQATGVVSQLYVKDGDVVQSGDKIAEINLDLLGQQNAAQALSSYQTAQNNLQSAQATLYSLQSDMFTQWQKFYNLATNSTYQNSDSSPNNSNRTLPEFNISQDNWLSSEAKYKNQQNVVSQTQTALNSSWLSYKQNSPTIYAPISGTVTGLSLQIGSVISSTVSSGSGTNQNSTKIASIKTQAFPAVTINLTEIDVPKVKIGNKVTVTLDALPDKTFTGKVISIDMTGVVSSGVTTYPTVIQLDTNSDSILSNMSASANIITATKDNILLVPIVSVQNQNGETMVRLMKNGKVQQVPVQTGLSSDTQIEIISGLSEGDTVVTSITQSTNSSTSQSGSSSPFSGGFGGGVFRGGGGGGRR